MLPRPSSWISGVLLLRGGRGREQGEERGGREVERKGGERDGSGRGGLGEGRRKSKGKGRAPQ